MSNIRFITSEGDKDHISESDIYFDFCQSEIDDLSNEEDVDPQFNFSSLFDKLDKCGIENESDNKLSAEKPAEGNKAPFGYQVGLEDQNAVSGKPKNTSNPQFSSSDSCLVDILEDHSYSSPSKINAQLQCLEELSAPSTSRPKVSALQLPAFSKQKCTGTPSTQRRSMSHTNITSL